MNNENLPENGTELTSAPKNDNPLNLAEDFAQMGSDIKADREPLSAAWKIAAYDCLFAVVYWALGYFYFINFAYITGEGIMALIFTALYAATVTSYLKLKKASMPKESYFWLAVLLLCAISKALYSNTEHALISALLLHGAAVYWTMSATNALLRFNTSTFLPYDAIRGVFVLPFIRFFAWFVSLVAIPKLYFFNLKSKKALPAFLGILIGGTAICIALPMLAKADIGFNGLVGNFLGIFKNPVILPKLLWAAPIAAYLFSLLFAGVSCSAPREKAQQNAEKAKKLPVVTAVTALGMLSGLYLLFLAVILWQLVPALSGLLPNGIKYSEYARTGFFELCKVCSFTLLVMSVVFGCVNKQWREARALKSMVMLICASSLGLCVTALARMLLYIKSYGLTTLRLTTSLFILILMLVFILIAINVFKPMNIVKASFCTLCLGTALMLCINTSNIIASYNLTRYESGSLKDAELSSLFVYSTDSLPALIAYRDKQRLYSKNRIIAQDNIDCIIDDCKYKIKNSYHQMTLHEFLMLKG